MEEINELDENWITQFEEVDKDYEIFYKDDVECVNIKYVFINSNNEIEHVKCEKTILPQKNKLPQETLLAMIKTHSLKKYKMSFILKYNLSIDPREITNNDVSLEDSWLTEYTYVKDIFFDKTITMFQDLNEINIFFCESKKSHNKTSKIRLFQSLKRHNSTKKHIK